MLLLCGCSHAIDVMLLCCRNVLVQTLFMVFGRNENKNAFRTALVGDLVCLYAFASMPLNLARVAICVWTGRHLVGCGRHSWGDSQTLWSDDTLQKEYISLHIHLFLSLSLYTYIQIYSPNSACTEGFWRIVFRG